MLEQNVTLHAEAGESKGAPGFWITGGAGNGGIPATRE
jgi:hypothetical protein